MIKLLSTLCVTLLLGSLAHAADTVKVDVFLGGELKQTVALAGHGSYVSFSPKPNTTLELRLVAPEPLIVDVKETTTEGVTEEVVGRVKLLAPGSSFAVSEVKGAKFHHAYVLVRAN